jgi:hypothetical protein
MTKGSRRPRPGDDAGSLPLAMLLTFITLGATVVVGTAVIAQITITGDDVRRGTEISAAQSGIEVALGQIRATVRDGDGAGLVTTLPCIGGVGAGMPNAVLTGPVTDDDTALAYSVKVYYLSSAPPDGNSQEDWARTHRVGCVSSGGTALPPSFALLVATGRALPGSTGRTLVATYQFQSRTKPNVPGGTIKVFQGPYCLSAGATLTGAPSLQANSQVIIAMCSSVDSRQNFAYNPSLQVELQNSKGSATFPNGACLDAASVDRAKVTFQNCVDAKRTQIWSLNNRNNFEGTTDGKVPNGKCFNVDYNTSPATVVINNVIVGQPNKVVNSDGTDGTPCSGTSGDYTKYKSFFPDSAAGTGAAGAATGQLVNYEQFGRCLDVSGNNVSADFMAIFPCKQTPNGIIQWNQVWKLPVVGLDNTSASGRVSVHNTNDKDYCLVSPGSTAARKWVRLVECKLTDPVPAAQMWTRRSYTGVLSTSYRIESTFGTTAAAPYCLAPAVPPAVDPYWTGGSFDAVEVSKLVLATCDDTNLQKWNASPSALSSVVNGYQEN